MLFNFSNTFLRGVFRIYFVVAFTLLGLVGGQVSKCVVKLDLIHGKSVRLNKMTGWVAGPELGHSIYKLRRLPGGVFLGLLMILASISSLAADLASSMLVYEKQIVQRCQFDEGLVINTNKMTWAIPPQNGKAALVVSNAQIISQQNGGYDGIYSKASFALNFYAQERDIIGWWKCDDLDQDQTYLASESVMDIIEDLISKGLQYPLWSANSDKITNGSSTHVIVWSSSQSDTSDQPFDVKASIDQGSSANEDKVMKNYHCYVDPGSYNLLAVNTILSHMEPNSTLGNWVSILPASIYDGSGTSAVNNTQYMLGQVLNSLTMVQGGNANLFSTVADDADPTYGCLLTKTYVSPIVLGLAAAVGATFLCMFFYWVFLLARLGSCCGSRSDHAQFKPVPDGLLSWMLQAARESSFGQQQVEHGGVNLVLVPRKETNLRDWDFTPVEDRSFARLVRAGAGRRGYAAIPTVKAGPQKVERQQQHPQGWEYSHQYGSPGSEWDPAHGRYTSVPLGG